MAEKSGVPRVQRHRAAAGAGWRMRFHRARVGNDRRADRADASARNVVLPYAFAVLQRLGSTGNANGKARPRASRSPRNHVQEGAPDAFENRFWNGYGWDSVDGTDCPGIHEDE